MIICSVHVASFGKLSDFSLTFDRSLHIIEGENEAGKSTLAAFLRFMLYGLDKSDPIDYGRGISRTDNTAQGEMLVEVKGKLYRLERKTVMSGKKNKPIFHEESRIIEQDTGAVIEDVSAGELWLGFPRSIYRRIACVGQLSEPRVNDSSMRESIENLLFSGDEKVNLRHAGASLTSRRDALLTPDGKNGDILRLRKVRQTLFEKRQAAIENNRALLCATAKAEDTRRRRREAENELRELNEIDTCYRNTKLLQAFEKLHDIKQQTNAVSAKLLEVKKENSYTGFIPDAEYLTELGVNRRLYAESEEACVQAEADLKKIESTEIIALDIQRNLQRAIKHGGEEAVRAEADKLHRKAASCRFFAVLTALLCLGCLGVTAWMMPSFLKADPFSNILPYCLALGIGLLLFVGGDIALWLVAHERAKTEVACYIDYGASTRKELLLRLRTISEHRNRAADQIMRIRAAHQYRDKTIAVCASAREMLAGTLLRWGRTLPEGDILAYTDEVEKAARAYLDTVSMLKEEKARLDTTASQLRDQLRGQNETAIRNKVPKNRRKQMENVNPEEVASEIATRKHRIVLLSKAEDMLSANISLLQEKAEDPVRVAEALSDAECELAEAEKRCEAFNLALSTFLDVDDRLKARITPQLASHALELIRLVTGGVYDDLDMDDDLSLFLKQKGESYGVDLLSAGTRDIAYMALRMAMIEMVCREELPPLCLDESFAYQDDTRALGIMRMLKKQADRGMQSLIFTCRPREEIIAHQAFGGEVGYTKIGGAQK